MTHSLSSSTESEALRIGDPSPPVIPHLMRDLFRLDSRFHGNDTPLVILNRKRSASDWGSNPDWIPVFTGMTHPLSSPTESEALRIGDPSPPVIPSLTGDPVLTGFPFSRE